MAVETYLSKTLGAKGKIWAWRTFKNELENKQTNKPSLKTTKDSNLQPVNKIEAYTFIEYAVIQKRCQ